MVIILLVSEPRIDDGSAAGVAEAIFKDAES
jgi:hypothetical protein